MDEWFQDFLKSLAQNDPTLVKASFYFRGCVRDEGAEAIAAALRGNSALQELDLRSCRIGSDGAEAIADALRENSTLRQLDLSYNLSLV